jgi:hypothetical protein
VNAALAVLQAGLELDDGPSISEEIKTIVLGYNRDDCQSTAALRDWLEGLRDKMVSAGKEMPRPGPGDGAPNEKITDWLLRVNALIERLTIDVPVDRHERDVEQQARWIPPDKGLFLEETWRLHPNICAYTSELFYAGRLRSKAGLECQIIKSSAGARGSGLRFLPIHHTGNQNCSPEEAEAIIDLVKAMLAAKAGWVDALGAEKPLTLEDILIITPYNAQAFEIQRRLTGARVGTVDKFQGQEAPIAIYSTATSSHADAPRGMEFLYSLNRLNVATSRAKCLSILVSAPQIFEAECRTPRQAQLANAFCRYLEVSSPIS